MPDAVNIILGISGASAVLGALGQIQGSLAGLIATSGLVSAAVGGVKSALDLGGDLSDLSKRTGQSVRDLAVLSRAYENAGLSSGFLAPSINLIQRALAGTNEEGAKTDGVLKRLGLQAEQLKGMSFAGQIEALTAAFARVPDPIERAALAAQLFGRNGAQMLQLIGDPAALRTAESEAGRLADRLQANAEKFDDIGDRLTVVKLRMQEMYVVAAERLLPVLDKTASLLQGLNLSVVGATLPNVLTAAGAIGGAALARNVVDKLNIAVLDWATRPDGAIGQQFAGKFLVPLTQGLSGLAARVLPIGLAAVIAKEVLLGLYAAYAEWQNTKLEKSNSAQDSAAKVRSMALNVRSESDRQAAIAEALKAIDQTKEGLREELSSWWTNQTAVQSYEGALKQLHGTLRLLGGQWAENRAAANRAADAAAAAAAKLAAGEAEAQEWWQGDKGSAARSKLRDLSHSQLSTPLQLQIAKTDLADLDKAYAARKAELDASHAVVQSDKLSVEYGLARYELLQRIAKAAAAVVQSDQDALEAELRRISEERATLDGDFTRSDATKWAERKKLIEEAIAAQQRFIDGQRQLAAAAAASGDKTTAAVYSTAATQGEQSLTGLRQERAGLGADPNSYLQQTQAALGSWQASIGTQAQDAAQLFVSPWKAGFEEINSSLTNLIMKGGTWRDVWTNVSTAVATSFVSSGVKMFTDYLASQTWAVLSGVAVHSAGEQAKTAASAIGAGERAAVQAGETAVQAGATASQVGIHAAGEGAKTGSSTLGALWRKAIVFGETVWHGIQVGIRTAAHIAGEIAKTAITLAMVPVRIAATVLEIGKELILAGIKAMSAMAGIPVVGPILAVAALGAIIAAGVGAMKGFAKGGIIDGGEQIIRVNEQGTEAVLNHQAFRTFGPDFIDGLNHGQLLLDAVPASAVSSYSPAYSAAAPATPSAAPGATSTNVSASPVSIAFFDDEPKARAWAESAPGQRTLARLSKRQALRFG